MPGLKAVSLLSLATLLAPAALMAQNANPARPGTLNYVEGQVSIDGQPVKSSAVGNTALETGQSVQTGNGKAEVLLTPGVFLRLGSNSQVTLVSPDLTRTEVKVDQGTADVEVDQLYKQNDLLVDAKADQARLLKTGFYAFDTGNSTLRVFEGQAEVLPQNIPAGEAKPDTVKSGHELALNGDLGKSQGFDKKAGDELYNWSSLRSSYLGEANLQLASQYEGAPGFSPGWFWDSGFYGYTWLPGEGAFFNPFGFGFYSPYYLYGGGPVYGYGGYGGRYGYGRGTYGRGGYYHGAPTTLRGSVGNPGFHGSATAGAGSGGFHGGAVGGGFAGGGGSFHGEGGGGGHR